MKKIVWALLLFICMTSVNAETKKAYFLSCIDGDTALFQTASETNERYRFIAIDAPEVTENKEDYGSKAKEYTCETLKNAKEIVVEEDEKATKDKYGRHLAWVWVDGQLLQKLLVSEGLAKVAYVYDEYKYAKSLCLFENDAIGNKKGIWNETDERAYCATVDTAEVEDNIDYKSIGKVKEVKKKKTYKDTYDTLKGINDFQDKVAKYADKNETKLINYGFYLIVGIAIIYILYKEFKKN